MRIQLSLRVKVNENKARKIIENKWNAHPYIVSISEMEEEKIERSIQENVNIKNLVQLETKLKTRRCYKRSKKRTLQG